MATAVTTPVERADTSSMNRVMELAPSPHLSGEDLLGPDGEHFELNLTIKSWDRHPVGMKEEMKGVLYFEERKRGLVINRTIVKMLAKLHGNNLDNLKGKRITIYFDPDVTYGGRVTGGLRIRGKVPA